MDQRDRQVKVNDTEELSFKDLIERIKGLFNYLTRQWKILFFIGILGGMLGLLYSIFVKPKYLAVCTFVLEDSKSGGMGQYAGLASLAGINVGGESAGIFEGDNILELYKSRLMIEKALLNTCTFDGKKQLLIDRFITAYDLRDKWKNTDNINNINFDGNSDNFNRKQDSLITTLVDLFNKNILTVTKPDKKLSIIRVEVETRDELFSKYFTERIVQTVNDFYIQTKVKKEYQNVMVLQHQADSVKYMLNLSINGVASATDAAPNANPLMSALHTTSLKRQVDVQANTAIYSEIVKNLELEKVSLRQEMPLIQVIDKPVLPLLEIKTKKLKGIVIGFVFGLVIITVFLTLKKMFQRL
jgi:capsular polysaccharide biosynthesis protein